MKPVNWYQSLNWLAWIIHWQMSPIFQKRDPIKSIETGEGKKFGRLQHPTLKNSAGSMNNSARQMTVCAGVGHGSLHVVEKVATRGRTIYQRLLVPTSVAIMMQTRTHEGGQHDTKTDRCRCWFLRIFLSSSRRIPDQVDISEPPNTIHQLANGPKLKCIFRIEVATEPTRNKEKLCHALVTLWPRSNHLKPERPIVTLHRLGLFGSS